ncbi:MAG: carboxypeptidase regulatory-like domain-containing protein, partial [Acidobacteriaceae bacterium]
MRRALVVVGCLGWVAVSCGAQSATTPAASAVVRAAAGAQQVVSSGTRVHGTITDPDGALIPGATVTLTSDKGASVKATAGDDGTYHVQIAPGTYTLVVTMPGFSAYSVTNLKVPAVASTTVDAKLKVGVETQVVNVDANAIQLSVDPDNNADSTVITGKDLEALSDDPDELQSELQALAGPSAGPNGGQIYVDGFTGGQLPPKSSIREIRINQNPFSAQYDKLGYGRVEIFTKPGTDKLHGNLQMNYNPSQFNDGNPLLDPSISQPSYHTTFLFGNLTGPLSKSASYNLGGSFRQIQDDSFTNATVFGIPGGTTPTLCSPGDARPACTIGTTAAPLTYQASTYHPQTRGDFNPRLDLALGARNVLTIRYQFVDNVSTNSGSGDLTLPSSANNHNSMSNILQLSDTENFSPRFINENRFEYEREHSAIDAVDDSVSLVSSGNFNGGGSSSGHSADHADHMEYQNYSSVQLKKNFIRFGARLRTDHLAYNSGGGTNGEFVYAGLSQYSAGTASQFTYTVVNNHDIHFTLADLGLYAEDDWKPIPNLTVSYGIRYETQNHIADHHDFSPRVSVSYGIGRKGAAPVVVVHSGFGIFYDRFSVNNVLTIEQQNGTNTTVYTVKNPTCMPTYGQLVTISFALGCGATAQTQTTYTKADNLRSPYIEQVAVGADYGIGKLGKVSVNYIHSQGAHAQATQNLVATPGYVPAPGATGGPIYQYFTEGVFTQNQMF